MNLAHWAQLALTPGIGPVSFLRLIERFGEPGAALAARPAQLEGILDAPTRDALANSAGLPGAEAALAWAQQPGCSLLTLADPDYPTALAEAHDPPPLLFARGRRELLEMPKLAMVGSRHATAQGCDNAQAFAHALAEAGYCVVSGLAAGIDAAAHRGALAGRASSIAVVGTGIDRVYPASNRELAHQLGEHGLILSEFPLGTRPLAGHFPRRNRIIAGLAAGTLVVEAALNSGSLVTARLASEMGREVMAIPGSIHNPQARGCHRLIRDGAKLVESLADIFEELGQPAPPAARQTAPPAAAESGHPLLEALGHDPIDLDTLAERVKLTAGELSAMLLELELDGQVESLPGNRYQRRSQHPG